MRARIYVIIMVRFFFFLFIYLVFFPVLVIMMIIVLFVLLGRKKKKVKYLHDCERCRIRDKRSGGSGRGVLINNDVRVTFCVARPMLLPPYRRSTG